VPYIIEDDDLMFDGKPLNLLYEENRWRAERSGGVGWEVSFFDFYFHFTCDENVGVGVTV